MLNIGIIDDHQIVIDGISALTEQIPTLFISFQAKTEEEAKLKLNSADQLPAVLLLDINLYGGTSMDLCSFITKHYPDIKILAFTMHQSVNYLTDMITRGARGYILKTAGKDELIKAIDKLMSDEYYLPDFALDLNIHSGKQSKKLKQLCSDRQMEVLRLVANEMTIDEIAEELFLSRTTVITHRQNLMQKLNVKNTAGLIRRGFEIGLLKVV